ncbi:NlpC/P60 family protein [Streptomyces sp. URMC 123]|uniref:C40 family peptidase n=1 Tax=Streptomyces sp. URMC 123 TaxID=3423403 RepID=UPI003F1A25B0
MATSATDARGGGRVGLRQENGPTAAVRAIGAATALVCAVSMLLAVPGAAYAAPLDPGPGPSPAASPSPGPSGSALTNERLEEIRRQIEDLHRKVETATEAYNAAATAAENQSKEIVRIAGEIVAAQQRMDGLKRQAGALARAQYRVGAGGALPPEARLLLRSDPESFFKDAGVVHKGQQATRGLIQRLATTQAELDRNAAAASEQWKKVEATRVTRAAAKKEIEEKLAKAKAVEAGLRAEERERLRTLEEDAARRAQTTWLSSGVLKEVNGRASEAGRRAIAFATEQIGKDYEWGAVGPATYDCSGLTSKAWAAAGVTIPRTSQEQWRQLPKVDIKDMRPGDLIIYHEDAGHVGMYVGDGAMVHAPRTGRQITIAGAGSMRILGVVRPDSGS